MFKPHLRGRRRSALAVGALAVSAALLLAGCSTGGTDSSSSGKGPLVVWVDATRAPLAEAYAKAHPSEKINVVTIDSSDLESKLSLIASDPSQQPDVIYTPNGQGVEFDTKYGYSQNLSKLVSKKILKGFGATLSACTSPKGAVDCLPGDVSTQMLFYNKALFDKWGYTVPTTWDEYASLSAKVATDHPGYVTGSCGDAFCPNVYYRASNCPGVTAKGAVATVDISGNADCTRVTKMLDPLIADKTVATLSPFDPDIATLGTSQHILMLPGFVWYGELLFQQTFKNPNGVIAAAPLPTWSDGIKGVGASVGGQWIVGTHTTHQSEAVALIENMTTNGKSLASAVTFPAYEPAAAAWVKQAAASNFYAIDPTSTFEGARSDITSSLYSPAGLDAITPFGNAVAPKLKSGSTLASQISAWEAAVAQAATDAGYTVKTKK